MNLRYVCLTVISALLVFMAGSLYAQKDEHYTPGTAAKGLLTAGQGKEGIGEILKKRMSDILDISDPVAQKKAEAALEVEYGSMVDAHQAFALRSYRRAGSDPDESRLAILEWLYKYNHDMQGVKSAPQASELSGDVSLHLQALQIAQNARIIELLEKIAAKK
jgi:hypothetical protein